MRRRAARTTTTPPRSTNRGGWTCGSRTTAAGSGDRGRPRPRRRRACAGGPRPARWPAAARRAGARSRRRPPARPDPDRSSAPPRAARSTNSCTAGPSSADVGRVGTAHSCSPGTRRRSRLVATTVTFGHVASRRSTSSATGSRTCSQLSSSRTISVSAEHGGHPLGEPDVRAAVDRQRGGDDIDGRLLGRPWPARTARPAGRGARRGVGCRSRRAAVSCPLRPDRSSVTSRWVSTSASSIGDERVAADERGRPGAAAGSAGSTAPLRCRSSRRAC